MSKIFMPSGLLQRATKKAAILSGGEISNLAAPTRTLGELGGAVASFGAKFYDQLLTADANREAANTAGFINTQINEMEDFKNTTNDPEAIRIEWDRREKDIETLIADTKSNRARPIIQNNWARSKGAYRGTVDSWERAKFIERVDVDSWAEGERIITSRYTTEASFGARPDGSQKGEGFLGVQNLKGGGVATEYSVGVQLESLGGKETDIPTLVPTLTAAEKKLMVEDIIPNRKSVPPAILQKAVDHANKRVKEGKSVFKEFDEADAKMAEIDKIIASNLQNDIWSLAQARQFKNAMSAGIEKGRVLAEDDAIYNALADEPYDVARQRINSMGGLTTVRRNGILSRLANDETIRQENLEVAQEADSRILDAAILDGTYTPEMARATSLDVDTIHKFDTWNEQRIDRINKGIVVKTDNQTFSILKDLAVAISDDRAPRQAAQEALQEASAQGLINDDDWGIVDNMIRTNYTASRKTAEANARAIGIQQIVGIEVPPPPNIVDDPEGFRKWARNLSVTFGKESTPSEKLRWRLYNQYMGDMREWFEDPKNKDKVKESYQIMESKAVLYRQIAELEDQTLKILLSVSKRTGKTLGEIGRGETTENTYKVGDKRTINGVVYTYNGKDWDY